MKILLRHIFLLLSAAALLLPMASCVDEEEFDNNQRGNFEALWKLLDEHYCFFSYKKPGVRTRLERGARTLLGQGD